MSRRVRTTAEAPTVDGLALHGGKLFLANAARGRVYVLDVAYIEEDATWQSPGGSLVPVQAETANAHLVEDGDGVARRCG